MRIKRRNLRKREHCNCRECEMINESSGVKLQFDEIQFSPQVEREPRGGWLAPGTRNPTANRAGALWPRLTGPYGRDALPRGHVSGQARSPGT